MVSKPRILKSGIRTRKLHRLVHRCAKVAKFPPHFRFRNCISLLQSMSASPELIPAGPLETVARLLVVVSKAYQVSQVALSRRSLPTLSAVLTAAALETGSSYCGFDLAELCCVLHTHAPWLTTTARSFLALPPSLQPIFHQKLQAFLEAFESDYNSPYGLSQLITKSIELIAEHSVALKLPQAVIDKLRKCKDTQWGAEDDGGQQHVGESPNTTALNCDPNEQQQQHEQQHQLQLQLAYHTQQLQHQQQTQQQQQHFDHQQQLESLQRQQQKQSQHEYQQQQQHQQQQLQLGGGGGGIEHERGNTGITTTIYDEDDDIALDNLLTPSADLMPPEDGDYGVGGYGPGVGRVVGYAHDVVDDGGGAGPSLLALNAISNAVAENQNALALAAGTYHRNAYPYPDRHHHEQQQDQDQQLSLNKKRQKRRQRRDADLDFNPVIQPDDNDDDDDVVVIEQVAHNNNDDYNNNNNNNDYDNDDDNNNNNNNNNADNNNNNNNTTIINNNSDETTGGNQAPDDVFPVACLRVVSSPTLNPFYAPGDEIEVCWTVTNCGGMECSMILVAVDSGVNQLQVVLEHGSPFVAGYRGGKLRPHEQTEIRFCVKVPADIPTTQQTNLRTSFQAYEPFDGEVQPLGPPLELEICVDKIQSQLHDMKLKDTKRNEALIRLHNGDINAVIADLVPDQ